jgi:hypothetical protein
MVKPSEAFPIRDNDRRLEDGTAEAAYAYLIPGWICELQIHAKRICSEIYPHGESLWLCIQLTLEQVRLAHRSHMNPSDWHSDLLPQLLPELLKLLLQLLSLLELLLDLNLSDLRLSLGIGCRRERTFREESHSYLLGIPIM